MNWFRRLRLWAAESQERENQRLWKAEQDRRRESLASQRAWDDLQAAQKWIDDQIKHNIQETLKK
jgi:hypothetical protein